MFLRSTNRRKDGKDHRYFSLGREPGVCPTVKQRSAPFCISERSMTNSRPPGARRSMLPLCLNLKGSTSAPKSYDLGSLRSGTVWFPAMQDTADKVIVVFGGAGVIRAEVSARLVSTGGLIVISGLNAGEAYAMALAYVAEGWKAIGIACDISRPD